MNKKESILNDYVSLAFKLGKLPSKREAQRFGISPDAVSYNYMKHSLLQNIAIEKHPELKKLQIPPKVVNHDIEQYRLELEKKKNKQENGAVIADASTLDYIAKFAEQVFAGKVKPVKMKAKTKPTTRTQTLVLSDLHFGADLKADETGASDYGIIEESRRFAAIIKEASEYKKQYRNITHLEILLLGDIIENQLHDPRTGATIAEQCARAIHLLVQGIAYLAQQYPSVSVRCATGNHGRNTQRHQTRAVHQKFDSMETIIYYAVKMACNQLTNVTFDIPKTPLSSYQVYGKRIGFTHGDTVISPGNPGTALNVKSMEQQVNRLNAGLPDDKEYAVIIYGHTHVGHVVYMSNGCVVLGNGSLPPPDPFAVSIGITESANTGQWTFESVPGYAVGDLRYLRTGIAYDRDSSLDKIIQPWKNF